LAAGSLSISSSELPLERFPESGQLPYAEQEQAIARLLSKFSSPCFLILVPLFALLLQPVLFFKPVSVSDLTVYHILRLQTVGPAAMIALLPWLWRASFRFKQLTRSTAVCWAGMMACAGVYLVETAIEAPRLKWFFIESAKARTPNPSFARNTLFWERRDFMSATGSAPNPNRIALVGSSQMFQSTDVDILAESGDRWEKQCLAGFGPIQYDWLSNRILERQPNAVVCWLSEFDFYREDAVPTNRLRWSSTLSKTHALWLRLEPDQRWDNRGEFVDLLLAAHLTTWRNRDHLKQILMNFWWNTGRPKVPADGAPLESALAESADLEIATDNLRKNVRPTRFVDVNFSSFAEFATELRNHGIRLIVFEGQLHPATRTAYPERYHLEVRERLTDLSALYGFSYIHGDDLLKLSDADFADGYHTNSVGRTRWSRYLSQTVSRLIDDHFEEVAEASESQ
jgi:hypothetical protein